MSATRNNGKVERPCAFVRGPLAVARPAGEDKVWMVGHVPSGHSCGEIRYKNAKAAKAALLEMLPLGDWTDERLLSGNAKYLGKGFYTRIKAIAAKHGGTDLHGFPIRVF